MGLVKTRKLAAMHPPSPAVSTFAKATVDETVDRRLRRVKGGDEAAEDFRSQIGTGH